MSGTSILETSAVRCSIGGRLILDSVSFEVSRGEFVSLIGPNGAGKTTLLKCLMKILPLESGSVFFDANPIHSLSQKKLATYAAYVPQADSRYLPFTVEEFVMTGRYPHLSPFTACSEIDRDAGREAMERTGTGIFASRRMSGLSGGERQLVMIASALAQEAEIMFLDEPAAFLDPGHESGVMRLLREINLTDGVTVVMVTHDINRAILTSDRTLVLDRGRVEYFGDSSGLTSTGVLERVYGRGFDYTRHPLAGCDIILPDVTEYDG
jgi:iron complex transport system ATP-binding protein